MFGTGFGTAYPAFAAYVMRHVDAGRRGAAFGSILAAFDTGIGSGSIATGWIVQRHGFAAAFAVAAALAAFAIPFFLFMDRRLLVRNGPGGRRGGNGVAPPPRAGRPTGFYVRIMGWSFPRGIATVLAAAALA